MERKDNLHHLRIYGHSDGGWLVEHHSAENDAHPTEHVFENGHEMLAHVAEHAAVPEESGNEDHNG
jgi:hypothetical protein